jgi:hypothetical protein
MQVSQDEIAAAALQFVRKVSGVRKPSKRNQAAFDAAVHEIAAATERLLLGLQSSAPAPDGNARYHSTQAAVRTPHLRV